MLSKEVVEQKIFLEFFLKVEELDHDFFCIVVNFLKITTTFPFVII